MLIARFFYLGTNSPRAEVSACLRRTQCYSSSKPMKDQQSKLGQWSFCDHGLIPRDAVFSCVLAFCVVAEWVVLWRNIGPRITVTF